MKLISSIFLDDHLPMNHLQTNTNDINSNNINNDGNPNSSSNVQYAGYPKFESKTKQRFSPYSSKLIISISPYFMLLSTVCQFKQYLQTKLEQPFAVRLLHVQSLRKRNCIHKLFCRLSTNPL